MDYLTLLSEIIKEEPSILYGDAVKLARKNGMCAIWGASCGTPFVASEFCKKNIQWADQEKYLLDRPSQPWTEFYNTHCSRKENTRKHYKKSLKITRKKN